MELTDTPIQLLRQGKFDRSVTAVVMGSMSEDSGIYLPLNATIDDFRLAFMTPGIYRIANYLANNHTAVDRMVALYGNSSLDGSRPPGSCRNTSHWYWAAKHLLADAEMFCPARTAAMHFARHGVPAFQFVFRHPSLSVNNERSAYAQASGGCMTSGSSHGSGIPFWFTISDGSLSVRSMDEVQCHC